MTPLCPSGRVRSVIGSALAMLLLGCPKGTEPCMVTSVTVLPGQITLNVAETANVTASPTTSNCSTTPTITWSSSTPTAVSVQGNGNQAQVTGLLPTTAVVTVSATALTVSGGTQVTVLPLPAIALNPTGLTFTATQGGANPASQFTTITNSGGGTLSGLSIGTIAYGAGATGWLQAPVLSGTTASPSVSLTVQPVTGSLTPGTYTATIPVQSGVASNSPQNVTVTFTVTPPPPAIALNPTESDVHRDAGRRQSGEPGHHDHQQRRRHAERVEHRYHHVRRGGHGLAPGAYAERDDRQSVGHAHRAARHGQPDVGHLYRDHPGAVRRGSEQSRKTSR